MATWLLKQIKELEIILRNEIDVNELKPYTSGTINGTISKKPEMHTWWSCIFFFI